MKAQIEIIAQRKDWNKIKAMNCIHSSGARDMEIVLKVVIRIV